MIEKIFANPGKKLKTVYKVVFGAFVVLALAIWVLAMVITSAAAIDREEIGPFLAALIGVPILEFILLFFVWLGMLAMVTFADMATDIKEIKGKMDNLGAAPAAAATSVAEPTEWACPKCGNVNAVASNFCNQCGQPKA